MILQDRLKKLNVIGTIPVMKQDIDSINGILDSYGKKKDAFVKAAVIQARE